MTIHELPLHFEFVFLEEIYNDGFAFHLNAQSPYIYLSEEIRPAFIETFDATIDELVFMDYTDSTNDEIESKVLRILKEKEDLHYGAAALQQKTIADL
jgi:hypothetical protein